MLTSVDISNFRNLNRLTLEHLGRVNLIAGKNSSGKTSILEALWLLSGPDVPELGIRVNVFRGLPPHSQAIIFRELFHEFDSNKTIRIAAQVDDGGPAKELKIYLREHRQSREIPQPFPDGVGLERSTRPQTESEYEVVFDYDDGGRKYVSLGWWTEQTMAIPLPLPGLASAVSSHLEQNREPVSGRPESVFIAAASREDLQNVATRFGRLQMEGMDEEILELLRPMEPEMAGLTTITVGNAPVVHAVFKGKKPVPIRLMGEGFNRLFELATAMGSAMGGVLLIDEIENGLHYTIHDQVFFNIWHLAKAFDVQVVATTHSKECIESAYKAIGHMEENEYAFHRIDRTEFGVKAVRFKPNMMRTAVDMDMDVR